MTADELRQRLLRQIASLRALASDPAASKGEKHNASERADFLQDKINATAEEVEKSRPLEGNDLPPTPPEAFREGDNVWAANLAWAANWKRKRHFNYAADDERRWVRWARVGVMPAEDGWLSESGRPLFLGTLIDRLLYESEWVLESYLKRLKTAMFPPKLVDTPELPFPQSNHAVGMAMDIVVYQGSDLAVYNDLVAMTEAKLRVVRREIAKREKKALPSGVIEKYLELKENEALPIR